MVFSYRGTTSATWGLPRRFDARPSLEKAVNHEHSYHGLVSTRIMLNYVYYIYIYIYIYIHYMFMIIFIYVLFFCVSSISIGHDSPWLPVRYWREASHGLNRASHFIGRALVQVPEWVASQENNCLSG